MGYSSEIAGLMREKAYRTFHQNIHAIQDAATKEIVKDIWDDPVILKNGYAFYYIDRLKWHYDYPYVKVLEDTIDTLDEKDYRLLRVGDDLADIEGRGLSGFYEESDVINNLPDFHVVSKISIDFPNAC